MDTREDPVTQPEHVLLHPGFFALRAQNDRKKSVILSEAKDPVRRTAICQGIPLLRTGFFGLTASE